MSNLLSKIREDEEEFRSAGGKGDDPYTQDPKLVPPAWKSALIKKHQSDLKNHEEKLKDAEQQLCAFKFPPARASLEEKLAAAYVFTDWDRTRKRHQKEIDKLKGYLKNS